MLNGLYVGKALEDHEMMLSFYHLLLFWRNYLVLLKKVEPLMGGTMGERDQRGLGCGEKIEWEKEHKRERV